MTKVIQFKDDTYLYGTIIEHGNNSRGYYIKYSDGTLIQYGFITKNLTITNYSNSSQWYYDDGYGIKLPISFKDNNYFANVIPTRNASITLNVYTVRSEYNDEFFFDLSCKIEYNQTDYRFMWFAIGKWK